MDPTVETTLQTIAAVGAVVASVGVVWQIWTKLAADASARAGDLQVHCRRESEGLLVTAEWTGPTAGQGIELIVHALTPSDAVVAFDERTKQSTPARTLRARFWRPMHMTPGDVFYGDTVMCRVRVTSPQKLDRIRLKLRLESTATKRTLISTTRWLSPNA